MKNALLQKIVSGDEVENVKQLMCELQTLNSDQQKTKSESILLDAIKKLMGHIEYSTIEPKTLSGSTSQDQKVSYLELKLSRVQQQIKEMNVENQCQKT